MDDQYKKTNNFMDPINDPRPEAATKLISMGQHSVQGSMVSNFYGEFLTSPG